MKVEIEITDADDRALVARLMAYRASPRAPEGTPFTRELRYEQRLALECLASLLDVLQRGAAPAIDCSVVEAIDDLKAKLEESR